jgi:ribosomal protein L3
MKQKGTEHRRSLAAILTLITISEPVTVIRATPVPVIQRLAEITRGLQVCCQTKNKNVPI